MGYYCSLTANIPFFEVSQDTHLSAWPILLVPYKLTFLRYNNLLQILFYAIMLFLLLFLFDHLIVLDLLHLLNMHLNILILHDIFLILLNLFLVYNNSLMIFFQYRTIHTRLIIIPFCKTY